MIKKKITKPSFKGKSKHSMIAGLLVDKIEKLQKKLQQEEYKLYGKKAKTISFVYASSEYAKIHG
jgi:hypothetical protein